MKRLVVILVVLALAALGAALLLSRRPAPPVPKPAGPTVEVDPPPRTVEFPADPTTIRFTYEGPEKVLPLAATVYQVVPLSRTRLQVEASAFSLATSFQFEGTPSAFWSAGNFAGIWDADNRALTVSYTKGALAFDLAQRRVASSSLRLAPPAATQAPALVSSFVPPPAGAAFALLEERREGFDGVVVLDRPGSPLVGYSLGLAVFGVPVLTPEYSLFWAGVVADDQGFVRVLSALFPFGAVTSAGEVALLTLDDAIANLNAGNGAVLGIADDAAPPGYGAAPVVDAATITAIELVYVIQGTMLRPAYFMTGSGVKDGRTQQIEALIFASPL